MTETRVTPLEPRKFFSGTWRGEGELIPSPLIAWLVPKEQIRLRSRAVWLTDTVWKVEETFEFSSGKVMARKMFAEVIAPDRLHVTADDMPLGADIILHEKGFRFTPYYVLGDYGGRKWRMRCVDENQLDENGVIHDRIEMFFFGVRVATMKLVVRVER